MLDRRLKCVLGFAMCLAVWGGYSATAQSSRGQEYIGTWSGTWDGSGSGEFQLTLEKTNDGATGGKVAVTTDGGNYNADLKSVAFDGNKMTATYDFPLDPSSEISISTTFDQKAAKGTWMLHPKGQSAEIASGTFSVARK